MSLPPPGSSTDTSEKEHLLAVAKATKKTPQKLLDQPPCPECFEYLWQWFVELPKHQTLTFQEIESWSRLTHRNVTAQEVETLRRLDRIYWKVLHGRNSNTSNPGSKRPSGRR